jgi:hypothetical protein
MNRYPHLAGVLGPDFATLSNRDIEAWMDGEYGEGSAEHYEQYLEGIFGSIGKAFKAAAKDVGKFATKAAPVIAQVGGGALQGAMSGAALGPIGMIGGAAVGGTAAGLSKYGKGTAKGIGGVLQGVTGVAGQFSPLGRIGSAAGSAISGLASGKGLKGVAGAALGAVGSMIPGGAGGQALSAVTGLLGGKGPAGLALPGSATQAMGALTSLFGGGRASTQLMSLLQRPETMQALAAMSMGRAGRRMIPVGSAQTPVPATAIANLVGQLANQASVEAAEYSDGAEAELAYMTGEDGEMLGDPALDRDRTERVWQLLNIAQAERVAEAIEIYAEAADAVHDELVAESVDELDEAEYYDAVDESLTYFGEDWEYVDDIGDADSLDEGEGFGYGYH